MAADNGRVVSKLQAGQHNGVHRGVRACIVSMTMHGAQYARVFVYAPPPSFVPSVTRFLSAGHGLHRENGCATARIHRSSMHTGESALEILFGTRENPSKAPVH